MQVKGVRLYAKDDIRLEEFELPEIKDDEILVKVMSDSICMSTWKMVKQGADHKRGDRQTPPPFWPNAGGGNALPAL